MFHLHRLNLKTKTFAISALAATGILLISSLYLTYRPDTSSAANKEDWQAGNIIDNETFTNANSMSVSDIQSFLDRNIGSCDIYGTGTAVEYGYSGTRAQYAAARGWSAPPYTCLNKYYEVPKTTPGGGMPANNYSKPSSIPAGAQSAAWIIKNAAERYNISPKVLLVKLATESAGPLTSDKWPLLSQYKYAMGAQCPDSGPGGSANCNESYAGFSIQMYEAAALMRAYLTNMDQPWWTYKKPNQINSILWNVVERGCGASNVFIQNKATAALYTYTPYQPNQAALNNMYGTGDNCSAYGNRNFWRVFVDWFGSTRESQFTPFFQLPGSVTTYMYGAGKTYYVIDDYSRLKDYGFETSFKNRVNTISQSELAGYTNKGSLPATARFEGIGVFLVLNGKLHPFPSEEIYENYGYKLSQEASLSKEVADILPSGNPVWRVAGESDGKTTYYVTGGKKQAICNIEAFTKLGTPVYSSQSIASLSSQYLNTLPSMGPIAMDGDIIESWGSSDYGIWQDNTYVKMNSEVAKGTKAVSCGAPSAAVNQLPKSDKTIDNLVLDAVGKRFVIDRTRKLSVATDGTTPPGSTSVQTYTPVTPALLNKLSTESLGKVVRVDNSPAVYVLRDGKSYGVPSESDLLGLGFKLSDVQSVSQKTLSSFTNSGLIYKPGRLIRESNSLGVYMVDNNFKKHPFLSESDFFNYGFSWNKVLVVPPGNLSQYQNSNPVARYIKENDTLYWLMDKGIKRRIPTDLIGQGFYAISSGNSIELPVSILSQFPMTPQPLTRVFRSGTLPAVYMIENGKKRAFTNESTFFSHGFTWSDVTSLSSDYVKSVPTGPYIQ